MSRIVKEILLELPPTLTTKEARTFREKVAKDLADMERRGIKPDLPYDFD